MRSLIEQRLAELADALIDGDDPADSLRGAVVGPVSTELEAALARPHREAAVLIPIVERAAGPRLLFTARSHALPHHAGQVSFPGGALEADESPRSAALREAHEEIGLEPVHVALAGRMRRHLTGTGFVVTPWVGFVDGGFTARPDPAEVDAVFEVPLEHLLVPGTIRSTLAERFGTRFQTFELDYDGFRIWGATAALLVKFIGMINYEESI